jgi:protein-arginine kinase activator protein McsA
VDKGSRAVAGGSEVSKVLQMRVNQDLESVDCAICGVSFASLVIAKRRNDGAIFYCPNGHTQSFGTTEADRLRSQLNQEKISRQSAERDKEWALVRQRDAESETKKIAKKLKQQTKRINAGVCPHCQRTFQQLARHMQCKHKDAIYES